MLALRALRLAPRPQLFQRQLHVSARCLRAKKTTPSEFEADLFPDEEILTTTASTPAAAAASSSTPTDTRQTRFTELTTFMTPRIGRSPTLKHPQVRQTAWIQLFQLATTKEDLEAIVKMMSVWGESGRKFGSEHGQALVRRCHELGTPKLALDVFGNWAKYNVPLSLPAGRELLYSLSKTGITETVTAAALFQLYRLPRVEDDFLSCAIYTSTCLSHAPVVEDALELGLAMIHHVAGDLEMKEKMDDWKVSARSDVRAREREKVWLRESLRSIDESLKRLDIQPKAWPRLKGWLPGVYGVGVPLRKRPSPPKVKVEEVSL